VCAERTRRATGRDVPCCRATRGVQMAYSDEVRNTGGRVSILYLAALHFSNKRMTKK
jgi:hypothetical protein